ncbi:MAG TPA: GGDEF domain-containing protein [Candidatus Dormibacteraeota bacterium]
MRSLATAPTLALIAARLAVVPVHADLLPSPPPLPLPLPTASAPVNPLPTLTPLPLPSVTVPSIPPVGGSGPSPSPTAVSGLQTSGSGHKGTGGGRTAGSGGGTQGGGAHPKAGGGGGQGSGSQSTATGSSSGLGPLPAFPGLPRGTVQAVTWTLVILVPLMLAIWVVTLVRTLSRLRVLRSPATLIAAASELGLSPREIANLSPSALEKLRDQLALDELTGCMRRATGIAALEREIARSRRDHTSLSIAFVDADGLKHANDTLGHQAGDQLLKDMVEGLKTRLRGSDFVFRYGGDEFVCVLPGAGAVAVADVLMDVQNQLRERGRSFSLGITEMRADDDAVSLLGRADEELYEAKRALKAGRSPQAPVRMMPSAG